MLSVEPHSRAALHRNHDPKRFTTGYTLVEMLVVLLIMGLLIGAISSIAGPSPAGMLKLEAERLAQLLNLAAAEARASGKSLRWSADSAGYRFSRRQADGGWTGVNDNDLLRPRTLPPGMAISEFSVESRRTQGLIHIDFTPQGLPLAYRIELHLGNERHTVSAPPVGEARALNGSGTTHAQLASQ